MNVYLMINRSENNRIGKELSLVSQTDCVWKNDSSIENPVIILATDEETIELINYVYIAHFNRYYFITDKKILTGGRYQITCRVDVLETYKQSILSLYAIVDKTNLFNNANLNLDDGDWVMENTKFNKIYDFPYGFNDDGEFILIVAGA